MLGLRSFRCLGTTARSYAVAAHAGVSLSPPNRTTTTAIWNSYCIPAHKQSITTTSRGIMICIKGSILCEHEAVVEQFAEDCDAMGSDPYPFYKKVISSYNSIHDRNRTSSVRSYICRAVMMMMIIMMMLIFSVDLIVSYMKILITNIRYEHHDQMHYLLAYRRGCRRR